MIICRTPFRISFFGGGTDYPEWYLNRGGNVLSSSINKYCYITLRYLPPFFEHRIRVVYSKIELCHASEGIQHPAVRETLRFLNLEHGLEIHHDGDLPARSGMGSSSSFTVGLLHGCYALKGCIVGKQQLAKESIYIEREMIKETVGAQDQVAAAYGGLNHISFKKNGEIEIQPLTLSSSRCKELNAHLMLFYTGIKRTASDIADSYVKQIDKNEIALLKLQDMVQTGIDILKNGKEIKLFGKLLHEAWVIKRTLSDQVSNPAINKLYRQALDNGATGGKIIGAGGGGFLLLFAPPEKQADIRKALGNLLYVPFGFEYTGSQIIVYEPQFDDYNRERW
jgi:D-glycero-alpha-D-manno-heptose-7-phosphate kinase